MRAVLWASSIMRRGGSLAKRAKKLLVRQLHTYGVKIEKDLGARLLVEASAGLALQLIPGISKLAWVKVFENSEEVVEHIAGVLGKGHAFKLAGREELFDEIASKLKEMGKCVDLKRGREFFVDSTGGVFLAGEVLPALGGLPQGLFGRAIAIDDGSIAAALAAYFAARKGYSVDVLTMYSNTPAIFPFRSIKLYLSSTYSEISTLPGLETVVRYLTAVEVARLLAVKRGYDFVVLPFSLSEGGFTDPRYFFKIFQENSKIFMPLLFHEMEEIARIASKLGINRQHVTPLAPDFNPAAVSKLKTEVEFINLKKIAEKIIADLRL